MASVTDSATRSVRAWATGGGRGRLRGAGEHDGAGADEDGNQEDAAHGEQAGT